MAADEYNDNPNLRRSISMPVKPRHLVKKKLQRSEEMEVVCDSTDYYPESPRFERRPDEKAVMEEDTRHTLVAHSQSFNNFSPNWIGSTIELNSDLHVAGGAAIDYSRKRPYRVIERNGRENVNFRRIPEKSWRYLRDFVTTLIELDWKYTLAMFLGSYFFSWFFFALLCYVVAYAHGDLNVDTVSGRHLGDGKDPCIIGVSNFVAMLIYSIETQTTIGFGEKYPSEECPETIFLFIMQIICSIAIEGAMVSVIYLKTARPAKQIAKLKFSDKAVICYRDERLCLLFRVCDPRKQHSIESKIRLYMIIDRDTQEGEIVKSHTELVLKGNGQQIIEWPELVCHIIDDASPLREYTRNAKTLNTSQFELYVSIVGTSPSSAQVTEARTSYVPHEIYWGQRFINIISYDAATERYVIDYRNFNTTISVDMPNVKGGKKA